MLFNAKNMQIDTKKIQEAIEASYEKHFNLKELIDSGDLGFPTKAVFGLAHITVRDTETQTTTSAASTAADGIFSMLGKIGKNKETPPFGMRSGIGRGMGFGMAFGMGSYSSIDILCTYGVYDRVNNLTTGNNFILDLTGDTRKISKFTENYEHNSGSTKTPRYITRVNEIAEDIRDTYFGPNWLLFVNSSSKLEGSKNEVEIYEQLEETLIEVRNRLSRNELAEPMIHYLALEDVSALNIIKIVNKGTDKESNYYTGKCSALVFEALINSRYEKGDSIQILKGMTKALEFSLMGSENDNFNSGYLMTSLDSIDHMMCTRHILERFSSIETLGSLKESARFLYEEQIKEMEKACNESDSDDVGVENKFDNSRCKVVGNFHVIFNSSIFGLNSECNSNKLINLIVPTGMDLSNSFKAKYI